MSMGSPNCVPELGLFAIQISTTGVLSTPVALGNRATQEGCMHADLDDPSDLSEREC